MLAPGRTQVVADGGMLLSVDLSANHEFDALAIFLWITGAVGVVSGAAAWAWRRMRGPLTALAVVVGSLVGAWFAAGVGGFVVHRRFDWPDPSEWGSMVGQVVVEAPSVDLWVLLVVQPLAAAFVYLVAVLLAPDADLGAGGAPPEPARGPAGGGVTTEGAAPRIRP